MRACAPSWRSESLVSKIASAAGRSSFGAGAGQAQRVGAIYLRRTGRRSSWFDCMPFTLAHPAAAIPLRRVLGSYAVLSALVIGSLTPDLAYFLPLRIPRGASHSPLALFWFCLPMGFAVYVVFHAFLKRPLVSLFPSSLRRRLIPAADPPGGLPAASWAGVLVSLLAGATTHIVWDAFTHSGAPAVRRLGVLVQPLLPAGGRPEFGENALQLLSTAVGFLVLGLLALRWLRRAVPSATDEGFAIAPRVRAGLLTLLLLAWGLFALPLAAPLLRHGLNPRALEEFFVRALVVGSSASAIALVAFGWLWQLADGDRRPRATGSATQGR